MPGEKGLEAGRRLGLHDVPGGAARGGPAYSAGVRIEHDSCFDFFVLALHRYKVILSSAF